MRKYSMRSRRLRHFQNHERWLVSYADFIALLFAFFVVMFASTQANQARAVSSSVREALAHGQFKILLSTALGRDRRQTEQTPPKPDLEIIRDSPSSSTPVSDPGQRQGDLTKS